MFTRVDEIRQMVLCYLQLGLIGLDAATFMALDQSYKDCVVQMIQLCLLDS